MGSGWGGEDRGRVREDYVDAAKPNFNFNTLGRSWKRECLSPIYEYTTSIYKKHSQIL